jgi:3-hydroxymyristoyl/3-hydroxydecanoyl-(acyl carrier protein) dehydratase
MDERFRAFTFVDRIHSVETSGGVRIRGSYAIPAGVERFPHLLAAEATGQLAAWASMAALDFKLRPVAGIAARIDLLTPPKPGQMLELAADVESVDDSAVAYHGTASVGGVPVVRLHHSVGPMVPMEDYDDPAAVRNHYELLRGAGAAPGAFKGVPLINVEQVGGELGVSRRAVLQVPAQAPFFADHFPRRPVFPGTLLVQANLDMALGLASELPAPRSGARWTPVAITDSKLRAFIAPGERIELETTVEDCQADSATFQVVARRGKKTIGAGTLLLSGKESA